MNLADYASLLGTLSTLSTEGAPDSALAPLRSWAYANAPVPTVTTRKLDLTRIVALRSQYQGFDRYVRAGILLAPTKQWTEPFYLTNLAVGGSSSGLSFAYPRYDLVTDDGRTLATYLRKGTERAGSFTFTPGPARRTKVSIVPFDANGNPVTAPVECCLDFWITENGDGNAYLLPTVIRQTSSFTWVHPESATPHLVAQPGIYAYVELPLSVAQPRARPLPAPVLTGFRLMLPDIPVGGQLSRRCVLPARDPDHVNTYRTVWNRAGVACSDNLQSYYPEDAGLADDLFPAPRLSVIEGPRGVGMLPPITSIIHAHAGQHWVSHAWGTAQIDATGNIKLLSGLAHKRPRYSGHDGLPETYEAPDFNDPNVYIVNENSWPAAVPRENRWARESWSNVPDPRPQSSAINQSRPLLPSVMNGVQMAMPQHQGMPTFTQTCRLGRLVRTRFHGNTDNLPAPYTVDAQGMPRDASGYYVDLHNLPPVIDEFITGLADPWAHCQPYDPAHGIDGSTIYISERGRHAISAWNADTGAKIGDVLVNPTGDQWGTINVRNRRRFRFAAGWSAAYSGAASKAIRAAGAFVAPEGLDWWVDPAGDLWLYFGSYAMGGVFRVRVRDQHIDHVCRPFIGWEAKSWFVQVKVCRGGPLDGAVATTTWSEAATPAGGWGRAEVFVPGTATAPDGFTLVNGKPWAWQSATTCKVMSGPGGRTESAGYGSAVAFSRNRISCSSSQGGLDEWRVDDGSVPLPSEDRCASGYAWYDSQQGDLLWSDSQLPAPSGVNADFDYWKTYAG